MTAFAPYNSLKIFDVPIYLWCTLYTLLYGTPLLDLCAPLCDPFRIYIYALTNYIYALVPIA